jgi:hypothetical protein
MLLLDTREQAPITDSGRCHSSRRLLTNYFPAAVAYRKMQLPPARSFYALRSYYFAVAVELCGRAQQWPHCTVLIRAFLIPRSVVPLAHLCISACASGARVFNDA